MAGIKGSSGGFRPGSGRKSKAEEVKLIEQLTPMAPKALAALQAGIEKGEFPFIKLFYEYYAGKPTDNVQLSGELELTRIKFTDAAG